MNIGIVSAWFERGAAYVSKIFENELEAKHAVFIYARGGEVYALDDDNWNKPNVHWGKKIVSPFSATVIDNKDFERWIKKNKIDLIIFNEQHWWQPVIWAKQLNVKTISYIDYYTEETIPFFSIYDALICNTKRHFSAFQDSGNAYYIPWGTNLNIFKPQSTQLVNSDYVTFFHSSGWDIYRKGTDILLKAFHKTKHAKKLIIHSQNVIDNDSLNPIIEDLKSQGRLELMIETVHAPGLYHLGDVYVYPSRLEGIGLTIPEALACGLAIVVPDNAPMNEFADENQSVLTPLDRVYARMDGYYWPKCEADVFALAAIIDELATAPHQVERMKIEAKKYADNYLDVSKNFKSLNQLVEKVEYTPLIDKKITEINEFETRGFKVFHKVYLKHYWFFNTIRNIMKRK